MAIQLNGQTVINNNRDIVNINDANVVSFSIGGATVTATAAEINTLVGISTANTVQNRIDNFTLETNTATLTQTLSAYEKVSITMSEANIDNAVAVSATIQDASNTSIYNSARFGVDYFYLQKKNGSTSILADDLDGVTFMAVTPGTYKIYVL